MSGSGFPFNCGPGMGMGSWEGVCFPKEGSDMERDRNSLHYRVVVTLISCCDHKVRAGRHPQVSPVPQRRDSLFQSLSSHGKVQSDHNTAPGSPFHPPWWCLSLGWVSPGVRKSSLNLQGEVGSKLLSPSQGLVSLLGVFGVSDSKGLCE